MGTVVARAHTNIALVKYWGKRDIERNLPAVGSLSLTLDRFYTTTALIEHADDRDVLFLDGEVAEPRETERVSHFLDLARARAGGGPRFQVRSQNHVPTAAGLASSASGFAALAVAANEALGLDLGDKGLTQIAREGSGSAARSIHAGFVVLHRGDHESGDDCFAEPCEVHEDLDVRLLVARCAQGRKSIGSTEAMERTRTSSPYYAPWVSTHEADLMAAQEAVRTGDLVVLGRVMERSTLKMHACALGADPGIWYFAPTTIAVMNEVRRMRDAGHQCWFTMDAGPHVKVLCAAAEADGIAADLRRVAGVLGVDICAPGPAASCERRDAQ